MKKIITILSLLTLTLFLMSCTSNNQPYDDPNKLAIYYFWSEGCPSCDLQTQFLEEMENKYDYVEIKSYDFSKQENKELLDKLAEAYEERITTAPVTFIEDKAIIGFGYSQTTGKIIEDIIISCRERTCKNPAQIINEKQ